ncbi:hypothetical protein BDR22DRAFT_883919 [Usnea florida]
MSINWVMLDGPHTFVPLPREKTLFTSPSRTALTLQTPNPFPGKEPFSIKCSDGKAILTNQRVRHIPPVLQKGTKTDIHTPPLSQLIYLPATPTTPLNLAPQPSQRQTLESFSAPLLSLQDTHVTAPFFGPNVWEGILLPVAGGGIPHPERLLALKLTFKEGGAFDFSTTYERMKETLAQAVDTARASGRPVNGAGVDADLEQLPAYEELGGAARAPVPIQRPTPVGPNGAPRPAPPANNGVVGLGAAGSSRAAPAPMPEEAPPGYEEVLQGSVAKDLERRVEKS